jgi:hypothetical protein
MMTDISQVGVAKLALATSQQVNLELSGDEIGGWIKF